MIQALIPTIAPILGKVVGNLFPDPEQKAKAEAEMMKTLLEQPLYVCQPNSHNSEE
jgi:hypothetical protein